VKKKVKIHAPKRFTACVHRQLPPEAIPVAFFLFLKNHKNKSIPPFHVKAKGNFTPDPHSGSRS
jgi:hypothetical protein